MESRNPNGPTTGGNYSAGEVSSELDSSVSDGNHRNSGDRMREPVHESLTGEAVSEKAAAAYGRGMKSLFPTGLEGTAVVPWPQAGRLKRFQNFQRDIIYHAINSDPTPEMFRDVDPRLVRSTQPAVTRAGVNYYVTKRHLYEESGVTYADTENPGNRFPVVYSRTEANGTIQHVLLSGHHRAAAALTQGHLFRALHLHGGYGPPR